MTALAATLRKQAAMLTAANTVTRSLGFVLRLAFARLMSPEALGVMELAGSVGLLALTPVTAGIPSAMSRMTARAAPADQPRVLKAGVRYVGKWALILSPSLLALSPVCAWLLGDSRTLPALLTYVPLPLLAGLCGVYSGYAMGLGRPGIPAGNECIEQTVRFVLAIGLLLTPLSRSIPLAAAMPGAAECLAGICVVLLFRVRLPCREAGASSAMQRELFALSSPMLLTRLCASGLRSLNAVLLPVCLVRSGLTSAAATAQFGLMSGMAMPLIMAPGVVTMALCSVTTPVVSRLERQGHALRRLMCRLMLTAGGIGLTAAVALWLAADLCAGVLFRTEALAPLLRFMCPLALLMSLRQVQLGFITGLGQQRKALPGSLAGSLATLLITAWLCPLSSIRIMGAAVGMMAGQLVELCWNAAVLSRCLRAVRLARGT